MDNKTQEEKIAFLMERFPGWRPVGSYPLMDLSFEANKALAEFEGTCECAADSNGQWEIRCAKHGGPFRLNI